MKTILNLGLIASAVLSTSVMAADASSKAAIPLITGGAITDVVPIASVTNVSQNIELTALPNRAGFVKNDFEITTSANVALAAFDDNTRFGVLAGANRGRAVFTGTSQGGSVAQCGSLVAKDTPNGGASLVVTGSFDFDAENGCVPAEEDD